MFLIISSNCISFSFSFLFFPLLFFYFLNRSLRQPAARTVTVDLTRPMTAPSQPKDKKKKVATTPISLASGRPTTAGNYPRSARASVGASQSPWRLENNERLREATSERGLQKTDESRTAPSSASLNAQFEELQSKLGLLKLTPSKTPRMIDTSSDEEQDKDQSSRSKEAAPSDE